MDLTTATAREAIGALTRSEISARELVDAQLARIDRWNERWNLVVARDDDAARAHAAAIDDARAEGLDVGPLAGLPMTLKDTFETAGLVTTAGAPALADHVPERDADVVADLRDAGAVVIGKTNVPLFAGDHQTVNEVYGLSRNPWDPARTTGGSSGGAAGAVAAGFSLLEMGSDIGGSIRQPAHFCGVCGHKPSHGLVSQRGHIPPPPGLPAVGDLGVAGPLARTVGDLRLLLRLVLRTGAFGGVPGGVLPPSAVRSLAGVRIGTWFDDAAAPIHPLYRGELERLAVRLEDAGATIVPEARPPGWTLDALHDVYLRLLAPIMGADLPRDVWDRVADRAAASDPGDRSFPAVQARAMTASHRDWMVADVARAEARLAWSACFQDVDVLLAPVAPVPAFPHTLDASYADRRLDVGGTDRAYSDLLVWSGLATMPLLPATVVPIGLVEDLPVGVQVVGDRWADLTTLAAAALIEEITGGFRPPTVFSAS